MFDTILSLPSEIKYIWCKKPRLGSILYILGRYSTLAFILNNTYMTLCVISLQVCEDKGFICDIYAHQLMRLVWF